MFALVFKNKVVEIAEEKFLVASGLQWIECDDYVKVGWLYLDGKFEELKQSEAEEIRKKIELIKNTAASLILADYPLHKQLNALMSGDSSAIESMNLFISAIRTKSNDLESALNLLDGAEEIKNFPIQF